MNTIEQRAKLLKITIASSVSVLFYPHTNAHMQSQIHGLPSRLVVCHCTYVCMCSCGYSDLFSSWISDFALFFFLCTHMLALCSKSSDLSSACLLHANVCAQLHSFKGDRHSWIRLSSWHLIHSRSLSFPLPCVLIRLWDVKPRLALKQFTRYILTMYCFPALPP